MFLTRVVFLQYFDLNDRWTRGYPCSNKPPIKLPKTRFKWVLMPKHAFTLLYSPTQCPRKLFI